MKTKNEAFDATQKAFEGLTKKRIAQIKFACFLGPEPYDEITEANTKISKNKKSFTTINGVKVVLIKSKINLFRIGEGDTAEEFDQRKSEILDWYCEKVGAKRDCVGLTCNSNFSACITDTTEAREFTPEEQAEIDRKNAIINERMMSS